MKKAWLIVFLVLLIDQGSKIWVKTNMFLGQEYHVFDWFKIHFVENNGMAFGAEIFGKLFLSVFRIILIGGLIWLINKFYQLGVHKAIKTAFALILAGAIGNVIDSIIFGPFFTSSKGQISEFVWGGGELPVLYGKVVDMLYFPLWKGFLPEWLPLWGGEFFVFFQPVFNIADTAISIGVVFLILYNKSLSKAFNLVENLKQKKTETD